MKIDDIKLLIEGKKSREKIELSCDRCSNSFFRTKKELQKRIRLNQEKQYCSFNCFHEDNKKEQKFCLHCNEKILNSGILFCSHSCAATYNNSKRDSKYKNSDNFKVIVKDAKPLNVNPNESVRSVKFRGKTYTVKNKCGCGNFKDISAKKCRDCVTNQGYKTVTETTIGEIKNYYYGQRFASRLYTDAIRGYARRLNEKHIKRPKVCKQCGYSTYVELCHIKPIVDFPDTATLLEVNGEDNTVYLCPNHHKELDLGILTFIS